MTFKASAWIAWALCALAAPLQAAQPGCPGGTYRMIVPAAPGGTTDIVARLVATHLSERLAAPVVVENKAGAGGTIGAAQAAAAKPDGCTMLMGNVGPNAINYALYRQLSYRPEDLLPVIQVFAVPNVLVVHPSVPARTVRELVDLARSRPGELALASSGTGQSTHLSGEMFRAMTGIDVIHVPYKGNAPAVADLLAGQVKMMFDNVAVSLPFIKEGKLRALGVTSSQRVAELPEVPTLAESGLPGFDVVAWFGLFYPAGTDDAHVQALHRETAAILQRDDVRRQIARWSGVPGGEPPAEFQRYVQAEIAKWGKVVEDAGIRAD